MPRFLHFADTCSLFGFDFVVVLRQDERSVRAFRRARFARGFADLIGPCVQGNPTYYWISIGLPGPG